MDAVPGSVPGILSASGFLTSSCSRMSDARNVATAVLMSACSLNDDSRQNDTYCAETTERLVTDHWLFFFFFVCVGACIMLSQLRATIEILRSKKQSNNNRIWLWNKQPKTLFISVRGGKLKPFFLVINVHQSML